MTLYWTLRIADLFTTYVIVRELGAGVEANPLARYLFEHYGLMHGLIVMALLSYLVYLLYFTKYRIVFYAFLIMSAIVVASNSYILIMIRG